MNEEWLKAPVVRGPHGGIVKAIGDWQPRTDLPMKHYPGEVVLTVLGPIETIKPRDEYVWDQHVIEAWTDEQGRRMGYKAWASEWDTPQKMARAALEEKP